MKRIPQLFCLILVITASSLAVMAQDAMSPAKRKLIAEFIVVSKIDKQMDQVIGCPFYHSGHYVRRDCKEVG